MPWTFHDVHDAEWGEVVERIAEAGAPDDHDAQYADENGFTPIFAVATPELLKALADTFGRTITNPPSTPHFVIAPDGSHGELLTGSSSADEIVALLGAVAGER